MIHRHYSKTVLTSDVRNWGWFGFFYISLKNAMKNVCFFEKYDIDNFIYWYLYCPNVFVNIFGIYPQILLISHSCILFFLWNLHAAIFFISFTFIFSYFWIRISTSATTDKYGLFFIPQSECLIVLPGKLASSLLMVFFQ